MATNTDMDEVFEVVQFLVLGIEAGEIDVMDFKSWRPVFVYTTHLAKWITVLL